MRTRRSASPRRIRLARWLAALALIPATCCPPAVAGELGRLFFTPERRQELDRQRQFNVREHAVRVDPTLTIDGIVTRSSGRRTVWINGVSQSENNLQSDVRVTAVRKQPDKVVVKPTEAAATHAKVGGTVNRSTGETTDLLGEGQITVGNRYRQSR